MERKSLGETLVKINELLKSKKEMSINSISIKIGIQWRTAEKALDVLKKLEIVSEKKGTSTRREERIFFRII